MAYLTFEEYTERNGKVSQDAFPRYELKAEIEVNSRTMDRIKAEGFVITDDIRNLMAEIIDKLYEYDVIIQNGNVSSYSNGTESVSYKNGSRIEVMNEEQALFDKLVEDYLPIELVSRCIYAKSL